MSGDIRSSDSEDLTDSSENVRVANGTSSRSKTKPATPVAAGVTQRKGGSNSSSNNSHAAINATKGGGGGDAVSK